MIRVENAIQRREKRFVTRGEEGEGDGRWNGHYDEEKGRDQQCERCCSMLKAKSLNGGRVINACQIVDHSAVAHDHEGKRKAVVEN